jgi:hypothetical protein
MCEIQRINRLKKAAKRLTDNIKLVDPLKTYSNDLVTQSGLTFSDIGEKLEKISSCASIIELKETFIQKGEHDYDQVMKVAAANYCKQHTICPICADRTQARRRARYNDPIRNQATRVKDGGRHAYIVTYTVTDGESLGERLDHLKESKKTFRKMGQRRYNKFSLGEAAKFKAAISTIEIKRGQRSNKWHVHCHDLVFTDKPIDYQIYDKEKKRKLAEKYGNKIPREKLNDAATFKINFNNDLVAASKVSSEWFKASGGDSMSIDIEPLQHVPKKASGKKKRMFQKMTFEDSIAYQAKEVLKYISKPSDNTPEDSIKIISETYNKRMVATYGEFRSVSGDDFNDPAEPDENTFVLVWDVKKGKYGEPQPGKVRDLLEDEEAAHDTRTKAGKLLGTYRRQRKFLLSEKDKYGNQLFELLDNAKQSYRSRVNAIWKIYRQHVGAEKRLNSADFKGCDRYSSTISLAGMFLPGSDHRDVYQACFT